MKMLCAVSLSLSIRWLSGHSGYILWQFRWSNQPADWQSSGQEEPPGQPLQDSPLVPAVQSGLQNQLGHQHIQRGRRHVGEHRPARPSPLEGEGRGGECLCLRARLYPDAHLIPSVLPVFKVFQCLLIDGENAGEKALREAERFIISDQQFQEFLERHGSVSCLVPESNEKVWSGNK